MQTMDDQLVTTQEAADILCVSKAFLERDRWAGPQIPYIQIGSRSVRYRIADLARYIEKRRMRRSSFAG